MTPATVVLRSLLYSWRGNLAVVAGVATAVGVLAGALLVGESVRGTLQDLVLARIGRTDVVVVSPGFFRSRLAEDLQADEAFRALFSGVAPIIAVEGFVTVQTTGRRAGGVRVYGVDERFWRLHGITGIEDLGARNVFVSPALAEETGAVAGAPLLVRVQMPSDVPLESLHGRKDDPGRTVRASVQAVLGAEHLGEFSLAPEQGDIRAVFVPLARLQNELAIFDKANSLILMSRPGVRADAAAFVPVLRRIATVEDAGMTLRAFPVEQTLVLGADAGVLDRSRIDAATRAAAAASLRAAPVFTYLANTMRVGTREVPYSLVTAQDLGQLEGLDPGSPAELRLWQDGDPEPIVLNEWAASDLGARKGDAVELEFYVWEDPGRLVTRRAVFRLAAVVPIATGHRHLAPSYPGITDSPTLDEWDPPFPLDLKRVRRVDEDYWRAFKTTPKAFIRLEEGQRLWGSRHGDVTSIRLSAGGPSNSAIDLDPMRHRFEGALRSALDPVSLGLIVRDVRADALAASAGVTDFGQYFVYFSFFLVVSALVLAALFFKLGVQERVREVGLFGALGAKPGFVRRLFLAEAATLSVFGSVLGIPAALGYGAFIVYLLRTRWVDAVGTTALTLHVALWPLVVGAACGVVAALFCTWLALRDLSGVSERALLSGELSRAAAQPRGGTTSSSRSFLVFLVAAVGALSMLVAGVAGVLAPAGAFFGAAVATLLAGLGLVSSKYRRPPSRPLIATGRISLVRLGLRNARSRPARSVLSIAVMAAATFILVAVDAFRKDATTDAGPASGLGGFSLVVESLLPIAHDLNAPSGRDAVGLSGFEDARFEPFRLRPGDDTSCLNLYQPTNPRLLGVRDGFMQGGRFRFHASLAETEAERANPWLLLKRTYPDGAIPVIADANSLTYVLHKSLGDDIEIPNGGTATRLRVVAALSDSLFQREVLMAETAFVRAFPEQEGYRFFLVETAAGRTDDVMSATEEGLVSFGADVTTSAARLAEFHRVENTYLATFQMLGGLGLVMGTMGLATVLLRNVVERRRELALLRAVGYQAHHLRLMLLSESVSLLVLGLVIGAAAAVVATVPTLLDRGGRLPLSTTAVVLLSSVFLVGAMTTMVAAFAATRQPLLDALRSE